MQSKVQSNFRENLLLISLFIITLIVTPYSSIDPINLPKMSGLGVLSFTLLASTLFTLKGRDYIKNRNLINLCLLFALQLLFTLVLSGRNFTENFFGTFGRNTGVLTYFSFLIILFVSAISVSHVLIYRYLLVFLLVGIILICYGAAQYFGREPFPYINIYSSKVFGTFGNPNFQSAFMGILGVIAFSTFWNEEIKKSIRVLSGLVFILSIFSIYATNSWQGFFNLTAGLGVTLIMLAYKKGWEKSARSLLVLGIFIAGLIALGILNQGPLANILSKASLAARRIYWEAALEMLLKHPFMGVGLDGFGDWFRRSRSTHAVAFNPGLISDSAHSVPLEIAAGGGIPLILIYISFLTLTMYSIVKVVRKRNHLSFGFISICAAWFSYQAQSLISINQIALGFIGWTLTGLIIGYPTLVENNKQIEVLSKMIPSTLKSKKQNKSLSFMAPLIGFFIGCSISLPPMIASNRFYEGLKTSDARVVVQTAYLKPLDLRRLLIAISILERNKFLKESLEMAQFAAQEFPDSYDVWITLISLTNTSSVEKSQAKRQLLRLEPNLKP